MERVTHVHTASPPQDSPWCEGCDALLTRAIAEDDARKESRYMRPQLVWVSCPECHERQMLGCLVSGTWDAWQVTIIDQVCLCDPYGAFEEVWEAARDQLEREE